jgi:hypothetical protein
MATAWQKGDRFQIQPYNCELDRAEGLVFELTSFGHARGRKGGVGWYFYAPYFDRDRFSRWFALADLEQDYARGRITRLPRSDEQPKTADGVREAM